MARDLENPSEATPLHAASQQSTKRGAGRVAVVLLCVTSLLVGAAVGLSGGPATSSAVNSQKSSETKMWEAPNYGVLKDEDGELSIKSWGPSGGVKDGMAARDALPPIPDNLPGWMKNILRTIEDWIKYFTKKVPKPVTEVDIDAYAGRWYNVRYDLFTTLFSSPDCASAFYSVKNKTEDGVTVFVNNSGLDYSLLPGKGKPIYLTGEATNTGPPAGDLSLQLEGVPRVATYRIAKLGPATYGAGYYEYSIVTDDNGLSLYVLARDVDAYFETYDAEVKDWLKDNGFKGLLWKTYKNKQEDCPQSIYSGNPWDSIVPPGITPNPGLDAGDVEFVEGEPEEEYGNTNDFMGDSADTVSKNLPVLDSAPDNSW